jgi:2-polyprenyl-3-methyl-5-hydroxy-6-metoxy-1,4-benzoquinol methylase
MEELKNCPVCKGSHFKKFISAVDSLITKDVFQVVKCVNCSFVFTNPRPPESNISSYYQSSEYISHSSNSSGFFNKFYNYLRNRNIDYKLRLIANYRKDKGHIHDYGCGIGAFLRHAKNIGYTVSGFEPNISVSEDTINSDLNIEKKEKIIFSENGKYDVITLWHVLEHIHNLDYTLEKMYSALSEDGLIVVAVPIINSWDSKHYQENWAALDVPRHLYHFTKLSVEKLFHRFGMSIIGVHPLRLDSYYISLLSEKKSIFKYFLAIWKGWFSNFEARKSLNYSSLIFFIQKDIK